MNRPRRLESIVFLGLGLSILVTLPACGTKDISTGTILRDNNLQPEANQGSVLIVFAPPDETYPEFEAAPNPGLFLLLVDGKKLVDSDRESYAMPPGTEYAAGNYETGVHHFAITGMDGETVFEGDGHVTSGALTRLYLFGPLDALQGRFVSYPFRPAGNKNHFSAINLVRSGGVEIEVVSCAYATRACTPVSPPLALGDTFDADFSASGLSTYASSFTPSGLWIGYRQVATPSLPTPPVLSLSQGYPIPFPDPPAYVAAPEYMLADGTSPLYVD